VTVLHQSIDRVARNGTGPRRSLRREPTVRVRRRAMRGVAPFLAPEVDDAVARILGAIPLTILAILGSQPPLVLRRGHRHFDGNEGLVAGIGSHQSSIRAHVLTHESFGHRPLHGLVEQVLQDPRFVEPAPAVLAERGSIPGVLVEVETHEPAQGHVALQLHGQLAIARNAEQVASDQPQQQLLRRNQRPANLGVQRSAHSPDRAIIDQRPNPAQRVLRGHEALQRQVVEDRTLRIGLAHHR